MKAVSYWFWIIGSVLIGLLVFALAVTQLMQTTTSVSEEKAIEEFESLHSQINDLCWSFAGNTREFTLTLGESMAVYASEEKHPQISCEKLQSGISEGNYTCIEIKNKRTQCLETYCNVSLPCITAKPATASLHSLIDRVLGKPVVFEYKLLLNRTSFGVNATIE